MIDQLPLQGVQAVARRLPERERVAAGDVFQLVERPHPNWPVARAYGLLVAGERDPHAIAELATMDRLAEAWREKAASRHASGHG